MPVHSNQIKVIFIIILTFNLVHLYFFFLFHIEIEKKCGWIIGGPKGMLPPAPQIIGGPGPPGPPLPTPMYF